MAKIVVGLYDRFEHAQEAVQDLVDNGFPRENISMVARDASGEYGRYFDEDVKRDEGSDIGEATAEGAGIGAIIGGLGGLLVGLGVLAIPGIGPVLAAGPLVATLAGAGIGAAAGGLLGALVEAGVPEEQAEYYAEGVRRGGTLVSVTTTDELANRAVDILNKHDPVDIERRAEMWRDRGDWQGFDRQGTEWKGEDIERERSMFADMDMDIDREKLDVVEEEMTVGKREVPSGSVRVRTYVTEQPVEEDVRLRKEHIDVERRPVDRPASEADMDAFSEEEFEVTATSEEAVVGKRARVVEEVEIDKDVDEVTETVHDTVRRKDVDVDQGETRMMGDFDEYEPMFRSHYDTTFSASGRDYDYYAPGYTYGYTLAEDDRYRDWDWNRIEPEARRNWERENAGMRWDEYRDAIRYGWETRYGRRGRM